ncbi:MAG: amidohydrolase [Eubacteriales bacterium]|nr:amidohydrolase [Eubacteriales bacterium]
MLSEIYADTIFTNGKVLTVDAADSVAGAVAVRDDRIAYVGDSDTALRYAGPKTEMIDLAGRTLVPGFIDAHMHLAIYSLFFKVTIDIAGDKAPSIEAIRELVRKEVARKKPGEWIFLWGYDQNKLAEKRHPTKADFDDIAPGNPLMCTRACGHMSVANSAALTLAGITDASAFKPGEVVVDEHGEITGLVKESGNNAIWAITQYNDADVLEGLQKAGKILSSVGITSVHDAGHNGAQFMHLLQKAAQSGLVHQRIYALIYRTLNKQMSSDYVRSFLEAGITTGIGDEHFKLGAAKVLLDGSTSGPSCATRQPYSHDPDLKGLKNWEQDELNELMLAAHKAGFQISAHAVGDAVVEEMVNCIEYCLAQSPRRDHRHRIEHCGISDPELIDRIRKARIVTVTNPAFITLNGSDYNRYYGERCEYFFANRSFLDAGIVSAAGSDCPVVGPNPLFGIYAAVTRKDIAHQTVTGASQRISILDALRLFTYNGAYASFDETQKGSVEPGKLADLAVLSGDLAGCDPEEIKDMKVDLTMIGGEVVYRRS